MPFRTLIAFAVLLASSPAIMGQEEEKADAIIKGRIAFTGEKDGNENIYLVNPDGSGLQQITNDPKELGWISLGPDGKKLVATIQGELILYDLENGRRKKLASKPGYFPDWSPDGQRIAYTCLEDSLAYVCVVDMARKQLTKLTDGHECNLATTWGPKGERIVFQGKGYDLYSVDAEEPGSVRRLTKTGNGADKPSVIRKIPTWSPDGEKIAFHAAFPDDEKAQGLYMTGPEGKDPTLIRKGYFSSRRAWTPDGQHLLVSLTGEYEKDLYLIDMEGEIVRKVLDFDGYVHSATLARGLE